MQAGMSRLQEQLDSVGSAAASAAAALEQAGAAGLAGLGAQQGAYLQEAQAAAAAAAQQLAAAYSALTDSTAAEQRQLDAFLAEQAAAGESAAAAGAAVITSVRQQLGAAKAAAAAAKAEVSEKLAAQAGSVASFERSFVAKTQTEQAALLEQIAGMLTRCAGVPLEVRSCAQLASASAAAWQRGRPSPCDPHSHRPCPHPFTPAALWPRRSRR